MKMIYERWGGKRSIREVYCPAFFGDRAINVCTNELLTRMCAMVAIGHSHYLVDGLSDINQRAVEDSSVPSRDTTSCASG